MGTGSGSGAAATAAGSGAGLGGAAGTLAAGAASSIWKTRSAPMQTISASASIMSGLRTVASTMSSGTPRLRSSSSVPTASSCNLASMTSPTEISSSITESGVFPARSTSRIRSKRSKKTYRPPSCARTRSIAGIATLTRPLPKEASETAERLCFLSCGRKEALKPVSATTCSEMSAWWLCAGSFTISRSLSKACSRILTTSGLGIISLERTRESAVSVLWANS